MVKLTSGAPFQPSADTAGDVLRALSSNDYGRASDIALGIANAPQRSSSDLANAINAQLGAIRPRSQPVLAATISPTKRLVIAALREGWAGLEPRSLLRVRGLRQMLIVLYAYCRGLYRD